jgi:16S rRNA (guanine527-N7)-methyltransferase
MTDTSLPTTYASLAEALAAHGIALPDDNIARLQQYCKLLWAWNEKLNLTRHTDYQTFVVRDVVDSLELAKLLPQKEHVLDLGTGGGVPGVILAVVRPDLKVTLCESVTKRAKALEDIVHELGLATPVVNARAEDHLAAARYGTIVARAVAPLWKLLSWLKPHWGKVGQFYVIKGSKWLEERGEARHRGLMHGLELRKAATYTTPVSGAENVILRVWPKA